MSFRTSAQALTFLAIAAFAGCAAHHIPGTEIPDTRDTRAVAGTIEAYRTVLEKRDSEAILALAAPDYFDKGGTNDPATAIDRAGLEKQLPKNLAALEDLRVTFTLRRIDFSDSDRRATAEVFFEQYYKVQTPNGVMARRDADLHRFELRLDGHRWLFVSGL